MKYLKYKIVPWLLIILMLPGVIATIPAYAQNQVILPSWIYDFTNSGIMADIMGGNNIHYLVNENSHTTLSALGGDPQLSLKTPDMYVSDAKYLCIEYRTDNTKAGELYVSHDAGVTMGESPDATLKWEWITDGEWHRQILYCQGWAQTEGAAFTAFRFDPMLLGLTDCNGETVDIRFLAFFTDEQSAKNFDLAAYQKHVSENGATRPEGVLTPSSPWPEPQYKELEVHADDNYPGTLQITYSEDGKYASISYGKDENAVSYTVPNHQINLFGGYAGTDDLGRSLFDASQVGVVTEDHDVGIFYYLWHGEHGDDGIYNMQQIIDQIGPEAAGDPDCELWGDPYDWHWWGEPLYGYYYADDNWVVRKHVELLINAGIDFLYFDTTNGFPYTENALKLMAVLHDFNKMGYDAPKVVFYTNTNAQDCVREIYEKIYAPGFYKDTWYMLDGKPVIVAPYEANIDGFFTVKLNQWPTEAPKENGWPWMDFEWPQRVYNDANGNPSVINVSAAQHSGSVCFSDSALYGNKSNLGRSFAADVNTDKTRTSYYKELDKNPNLFVQGINFQAQWDRAIEADVPFVLVTGWNEWIAQRMDDPTKVGFMDCASYEFSRDTEMMKGGYFDNYYVQLAYNIQRLKGAAPVIVQDARNAINLTGSFDVWEKVLVTYTDPSKDMLDRDAYGFGGTKYENRTGNNDIVASKVTADTKNVYFYVQTRENISLPAQDSAWMQLLISTGGEGWYGYDYIVNYKTKDLDTTTVARYCGTDGSYAFEEIGEISYRVKGNQMMIAVPLEMLGITNPCGIKFDFKWVDSRSTMNTMEQFYTDGDTAPLGRFNYTFQNCLDPKTAPQYVPGDQVQEQPPQKSGCKSVIPSYLATICLAALPLVIKIKKKQFHT